MVLFHYASPYTNLNPYHWQIIIKVVHEITLIKLSTRTSSLSVIICPTRTFTVPLISVQQPDPWAMIKHRGCALCSWVVTAHTFSVCVLRADVTTLQLSNANTLLYRLRAAEPLTHHSATVLFSQPFITHTVSQLSNSTTGWQQAAGLVALHSLLQDGLDIVIYYISHNTILEHINYIQ